LQAISGAQFMSIQEPPRQTPQVITREDLSPAGTQESKLRQSSLPLWITQFTKSMMAGDCAVDFDPTTPPNNWQESS